MFLLITWNMWYNVHVLLSLFVSHVFNLFQEFHRNGVVASWLLTHSSLFNWCYYACVHYSMYMSELDTSECERQCLSWTILPICTHLYNRKSSSIFWLLLSVGGMGCVKRGRLLIDSSRCSALSGKPVQLCLLSAGGTVTPTLLQCFMCFIDTGIKVYCSVCFRASAQSTNATRQQTTPLVYQVTTQPLVSPSVTFTEAPTAPSINEQLQLYTVFVAVATVVGFVFAVAMVQVCMSAGKRCHDNMLEALMRAKISFFLISSVGEWSCCVSVTVLLFNAAFTLYLKTKQNEQTKKHAYGFNPKEPDPLSDSVIQLGLISCYKSWPTLTSPSDWVFCLIGIQHALFSSNSVHLIASEITYHLWCTTP